MANPALPLRSVYQSSAIIHLRIEQNEKLDRNISPRRTFSQHSPENPWRKTGTTSSPPRPRRRATSMSPPSSPRPPKTRRCPRKGSLSSWWAARPTSSSPRSAYTTSNDTPTSLNSDVSWRFSFALISSNRRTVSWE